MRWLRIFRPSSCHPRLMRLGSAGLDFYFSTVFFWSINLWLPLHRPVNGESAHLFFLLCIYNPFFSLSSRGMGSYRMTYLPPIRASSLPYLHRLFLFGSSFWLSFYGASVCICGLLNAGTSSRRRNGVHVWCIETLCCHCSLQFSSGPTSLAGPHFGLPSARRQLKFEAQGGWLRPLFCLLVHPLTGICYEIMN